VAKWATVSDLQHAGRIEPDSHVGDPWLGADAHPLQDVTSTTVIRGVAKVLLNADSMRDMRWPL
jgi:hypothetical protein